MQAGAPIKVYGMMTRGRAGYNYWVTSYTLEAWAGMRNVTLQDRDTGSDMIPANVDNSNVVLRRFSEYMDLRCASCWVRIAQG